MDRNRSVKKLVILSMLGAIAYVLMVTIRVPVVLFLKYEPKDVIIAIGGFLYGPLSSALVSLLVSLLEMVTVSETGPIGCLMSLSPPAALPAPPHLSTRKSTACPVRSGDFWQALYS